MSAARPASAGPVARLAAAWQARNPRERKLLLAAAAVIALAALLSVLEWSQSQRGRLLRALPRAEAQLEQVQESATEITRLRSQPIAQHPSGAALLETVRASAKSRGLALTVELAGDALQVRGQAGFDTFVAWLATLQQDQGLRVGRLDVQPQGNTVSIDASLVAAAP